MQGYNVVRQYLPAQNYYVVIETGFLHTVSVLKIERGADVRSRNGRDSCLHLSTRTSFSISICTNVSMKVKSIYNCIYNSMYNYNCVYND